MRRIAFLLAAAGSLFFGPAVGAAWAQRARYGGTLVMTTRARAQSPDPDPAAADLRRVMAVVFEGIVGREANGAITPRLALSWTHDADFRRWQFLVPPQVKTHDGTVLTPAMVAAALSRLASPRVVSAGPEGITIQCGQPEPGLLEELAEPRYRLSWKNVGTGPFKLGAWVPGQSATLLAHEAAWQGRPFLDAVEVRMGRGLREQLLDFEAGRADVVELTLTDSRRQAGLPGREVWHSAPLDLVALIFVRSRAGVQDERLRRGLALSIDRAPIVQVLLQRLGEATGSFLPQRVSGYGFLFGAERDLERATQLLTPAPAHPLVLGYDAIEPSLRLIAERIALNARDAGVTLKTSPTEEPDLVLVRVSATATDPKLALLEYGRGLQMPLPVFGRSREEVWQAERKSRVGGWVVPLFHVPGVYGLRARVRNWVKPGAVWWRLDEMWIEADR